MISIPKLGLSTTDSWTIIGLGVAGFALLLIVIRAFVNAVVNKLFY